MEDTQDIALGSADELDIFEEPEDYYKKPDPETFDFYDRIPELVKENEYRDFSPQ